MQPLVLPGVLAMIALPRIPTTPRESRPSGLHNRIASARPGRLTLDHGTGSLGRLVARGEARAAGRHDHPGEPVRHLRERRRDQIARRRR